MGLILIIISIILLIIIIKFIIKNYRFKLHNITFFQADVGGGKTALKTHLALKSRKKRIIYNFFVPIINVLIWFIPIFNIILLINFLIYKKRFKLDKKSTLIYSTYPIYINKRVGYSLVIDRTFYNWKNKIVDGSIVVTDEMGYLMPSIEKKAESIDNFTLTWIRHACNPLIFASSQNLGECLKTFRNKTSHVYELISCERVPLLFLFNVSRVYVKECLMVENLTNVYNDNDKDFKENCYYFKYPKNHFDSRYGKQFYNLEYKTIEELADEYDRLLKKLNLKFGDKWNTLYYDFVEPQQ